MIYSACTDLTTYRLVEVFSNHRVRVGAIVIPLTTLDSILNEAGGGLLERGGREALLCIEKACSALTCCPIPPKATRVDPCNVPAALIATAWWFESRRLWQLH